MEDADILRITEPQNRVHGPYVVIYQSPTEPIFAVVALGWGKGKAPALGIRWFYRGGGFPTWEGAPAWFMIPDVLREPVLTGLRDLGEAFGLSETRRSALKAFFREDITGGELAKFWRGKDSDRN